MRTATFGLRTVKLAPRTGIENVFVIAARVSQVVLALIATVYALDYAEIILAPISLGMVIGLMFSPLARMIERRGVPTFISGLVIVFAFILLLLVIGTAIAVPLSNWIDKAPDIWKSLQLHVQDWKGVISSLSSLQSQLGNLMGQTGAMIVKLDNNSSTVESVATLGPAIVAELLLFFASIYFFIATRDQFRISVLSLCMTRRLRWRIAHFFRDVEILISRYLLTITTVNICLGIAVTLALWAVGMPSPMLWGVLAVVMNYVIYVGPATMALILLSISLATRHGIDIVLPPAVYLGLHFIESQFVTAQVLGVTMTMNPFLVFVSLSFWIWLWGPIGGFIAVPSLLVIYALLRNTVQMRNQPAALAE